GIKWRVSTLGAISPFIVQGGTLTFEQLFWQVSKISNSDLELLNPNFTYIFELCAIENQNVTAYEYDHVVLLGIRNRITGEHVPIFDKAPVNFLKKTVRLPYFFRIRDIGIKDQNQLWDWVEHQSEIHEKYGRNPEGFVVYSPSGGPLAKCKNKKYL